MSDYERVSLTFKCIQLIPDQKLAAIPPITGEEARSHPGQVNQQCHDIHLPLGATDESKIPVLVPQRENKTHNIQSLSLSCCPGRVHGALLSAHL